MAMRDSESAIVEVAVAGGPDRDRFDGDGQEDVADLAAVARSTAVAAKHSKHSFIKKVILTIMSVLQNFAKRSNAAISIGLQELFYK